MASIDRRTRIGILALAFITACGGAAKGGTTEPGGSTSSSVTVGNNFFNPVNTTVTVGTRVVWTWVGGVAHNVTFDDGTASMTQSSGSYSRTFATAGTYTYHCTIHGKAMSGTVVVTQPQSQGTY